MAPRDIEQQTFEVISCLFNEDSAEWRYDEGIATDAGDSGDDDGGFDASSIAAQLRRLGDDYDENVIQPLMRDLALAAEANQEKEVFGQIVESLCQVHMAQRAEMAPEMQLLGASVSLCRYVQKSSPALTRRVQSAMEAFVNNRLTVWLTQQGGWDQVFTRRA